MDVFNGEGAIQHHKTVGMDPGEVQKFVPDPFVERNVLLFEAVKLAVLDAA